MMVRGFDRTRASAAAVARELGVSDVAVFKAATAGRISRNADKTFDIDKVKLQWAVNTSPTRGGSRKAPPTPSSAAEPDASSSAAEQGGVVVIGSLLEARTLRENYEAQSAKLKYQEQAGQLIERGGIDIAIATAFGQLRDAMVAVPDKLPIDDEMRQAMRDKITDALADAVKMLPEILTGKAPGDDAQQ
jgi:hypothetical protein